MSIWSKFVKTDFLVGPFEKKENGVITRNDGTTVPIVRYSNRDKSLQCKLPYTMEDAPSHIILQCGGLLSLIVKCEEQPVTIGDDVVETWYCTVDGVFVKSVDCLHPRQHCGKDQEKACRNTMPDSILSYHIKEGDLAPGKQ